MAGKRGRPTRLTELTQLDDRHVPDDSALLAEPPGAVLVVDLGGTIRRRSPGFSRLFDDVEPYELNHLRDLFDEASRVLVPDAVAAAFAAADAGREGIVDIADCLRAAADIGYDGPLSIEHEPEEGDPRDAVARSRAFVEALFEGDN